MRHLLVVPCLLALAVPAIAAETGKTYVEGGAVYTFISDSGYEVNPTALKLTVGHEFTDWVAVEAFAGTGIIDSSTNILGASVNTRIDNLYGVYLRPFHRSANGYEVFARLGYAHGRLSVSAAGPGGTLAANANDGSFSFGIGGAIPLGENTRLTVDWMRYYQGAGTTINGLGAGLRFHF